ncbi:zinc-dependent alcohol dehydrogenase [Roseovarius phycicola]|uniref:Zinc-binding alcohol dehydrogenase n=1 Tax=Roseovarius phycicola TaxID=3080976 RepID=A0ABZ2HP36_9RHOB
MSARALWCVGSAQADIRPAALGEGVLVDTLYSGISRGTERKVFEGNVPETEFSRMRGPAQEGEFPHPVKYGYSVVGRVLEGELRDQNVFALHPHQTEFRLPDTMLHPLPEALPPERAVLAANMETALNILWDANAGPGDKILVIGTGVVGALAGYLAARIPGTEVTLADINPDRSTVASCLGCEFTMPDTAPQLCDIVIHLSGSAAGLQTAIDCAGNEAQVIEASWYGAGTIAAPLGGAFHSRRVSLISSQVGQVSPKRRPRWSHKRRIGKALELLCDPALNVLISGETMFEELPQVYGSVLSDPDTLCHRVRYTSK